MVIILIMVIVMTMIIVVVIIIAAGSLALVVIMNLTEVNISERIREIANSNNSLETVAELEKIVPTFNHVIIK